MIVSTPNVIIDSEQTAWRGRYRLDLVTFRQRRFDAAWAAPRTWELWVRGQAAALLPYDPRADAVVLIEQFRLPAHAAGFDGVMLEVPAGLCDGNDTAEATIRREAKEEARLEVLDLEQIGEFLLSPGASDEWVTLFAGHVTAPASDDVAVAGYAGLADEGEDIRIRVFPALQAIEDAFSGRIKNATTMIALLWLAAKRDELRQRWKAA